MSSILSILTAEWISMQCSTPFANQTLWTNVTSRKSVARKRRSKKGLWKALIGSLNNLFYSIHFVLPFVVSCFSLWSLVQLAYYRQIGSAAPSTHPYNGKSSSPAPQPAGGRLLPFLIKWSLSAPLLCCPRSVWFMKRKLPWECPGVDYG